VTDRQNYTNVNDDFEAMQARATATRDALLQLRAMDDNTTQEIEDYDWALMIVDGIINEHQ
jgi:hypothetical protein